MADANVANALLIFTKTNTTILKRLDKIEKKVDKVNKTQAAKPEEVIEEAEPVEIDSLGKDARQQLGRLLNQQAYLNLEHQKKLNKEFEKKPKSSSMFTGMGKGLINSLLNVGGIALLGALVIDILKRIFSGPGLLGFGGGIGEMKAQTKLVAEGALKLIEGLTEAVTKTTKSIEESLAKLAEKAFGKSGDKALAQSAEKATGEALVKGTTKVAPTALKESATLANKAAVANANAALGGSILPQSSRGGMARFDPSRQSQAAKEALDPTKYNLFPEAVETAAKPGKQALGFFDRSKKYLLEKAGAILSPIKKVLASSGAIKWLLRILQFPGVADLIFALVESKGIIDDYNDNKIDKKTLHRQIGTASAGAIGSTLGGVAGAAFLGPLGGPFAPLTALAGTAAGTFLGDSLGRYIANNLKDSTIEKFGEGSTKYLSGLLPFMKGDFSKKYAEDMSTNSKSASDSDNLSDNIKVNDGIMMPGGTIIEPHKDDTVYAMKAGGPLDKYFNNNIKETQTNTSILKKYAINSTELLSRQIDILVENNRVLKQVADKLSTKQNNSPVTVNNTNYSNADDNTLRNVQAMYA
jgi:hypothetical protein